MDDDEDEDASVCPSERRARRSVWDVAFLHSFARSSRAGRVVFVGEDVVVVVSSGLLVFKSFLWRRTNER